MVAVQVCSRHFSHEPGFSALSSSVSPVKNGKSVGRGILNVVGAIGCCDPGGELCDEAVGVVLSDGVMSDSEFSDESVVLEAVCIQVWHLSARKLCCAA